MIEPIGLTAYDLAQRFVGVKEIPGTEDNAQILAMLRLDVSWPGNDEVAWCSAFTNYIAWLLRLPRSKSLGARSWLTVGVPIDVSEAEPGFDVVILKRSTDPDKEPGPEVTDAPGHVGFFAGLQGQSVLLLGGNQGNSVCVEHFDEDLVLGVRRLKTS